ncbi:hypothetical protein WN55_03502 [Dufourea novaeangliae]|uniref:Uncharacterized protein n=1 Tax=Dufourea novaeangliae TaxID=178035 RepID=A0A154PJN1_DUFNO|nr:hypothetical protein WN55_03502 [Dufourea novaeangliae]
MICITKQRVRLSLSIPYHQLLIQESQTTTDRRGDEDDDLSDGTWQIHCLDEEFRVTSKR